MGPTYSTILFCGLSGLHRVMLGGHGRKKADSADLYKKDLSSMRKYLLFWVRTTLFRLGFFWWGGGRGRAFKRDWNFNGGRSVWSNSFGRETLGKEG